ncbi:MAG: hypothetical protein JOZ47_18610 [Kutzneria sp.]|nr:hypothetical protein [Kutzneria sp.]MBV9847055.1 hypothetical protein [Kutzneria sp.]
MNPFAAADNWRQVNTIGELHDQLRLAQPSLVYLYGNGGVDDITAVFGVLYSLARGFAETGFGGVIGTEAQVREPEACVFAERLVNSLLRDGASVGLAVRDSRLAVLEAGSGIGLAYVALAPAGFRLVAPTGAGDHP